MGFSTSRDSSFLNIHGTPLETNVSVALGTFVIWLSSPFHANLARFMSHQNQHPTTKVLHTAHWYPAVGSGQASRYTCRVIIAVSPSPSTKPPKLLDTLSSDFGLAKGAVYRPEPIKIRKIGKSNRLPELCADRRLGGDLAARRDRENHSDNRSGGLRRDFHFAAKLPHALPHPPQADSRFAR
jgi:hypothetical protein